jgi:hypothetical protein
MESKDIVGKMLIEVIAESNSERIVGRPYPSQENTVTSDA